MTYCELNDKPQNITRTILNSELNFMPGNNERNNSYSELN